MVSHWSEVSLVGTMPPRMTIVEGGRKRVVCSWRGKRGIGARVRQVGVLSLGGMEAESAELKSEHMARN